ncbi:MAG: MotA/TolQ/ExbB proton channel family protein, partial [Calditrichaeota bacterium]
MNRLGYNISLLVIAFLLFAAFVPQQEGGAQEAPAEENVTSIENQSISQQQGNAADFDFTNINDVKSFWHLTEMGGNIRWAIFLIFGAALFLGLKKITELFLDARAGHDLGRVPMNEISFEDLQELLKKSKSSLIGFLMEKLFEIYYSTGRVEVLQEEVISFRKVQEDTFSRFKNRMSFLGDTAGALGLIGTVWGMFSTFFGGDMDSQHVLRGMGIALVTTLLGLIVSIIINFASTEIGNYF